MDKLFSYNIAPSISSQNNLYFSDLVTDQIKEVYSVNFINAAAWLIPKHTIETVGFFDELFFHYGEDENYCQKVLYHNLKICFSPNSIAYHDRGNRIIEYDRNVSSIKKRLLVELSNVNNNKEYINNRIQYLKKHYLIRFIVELMKFSYKKENLELFNFIKNIETKVFNSWKRNR